MHPTVWPWTRTSCRHQSSGQPDLYARSGLRGYKKGFTAVQKQRDRSVRPHRGPLRATRCGALRLASSSTAPDHAQPGTQTAPPARGPPANWASPASAGLPARPQLSGAPLKRGGSAGARHMTRRRPPLAATQASQATPTGWWRPHCCPAAALAQAAPYDACQQQQEQAQRQQQPQQQGPSLPAAASPAREPLPGSPLSPLTGCSPLTAPLAGDATGKGGARPSVSSGGTASAGGAQPPSRGTPGKQELTALCRLATSRAERVAAATRVALNARAKRKQPCAGAVEETLCHSDVVRASQGRARRKRTRGAIPACFARAAALQRFRAAPAPHDGFETAM